MTRVVFLVPRRDDNGPRDRLWRVCRARWEALFPEWPIVEGYHTEGPWNRSAAINEAARLAGDWDVGIIIDADVMLDEAPVRESVTRAAETGKVVWSFTGWREMTEAATERVLRDPSVVMGPVLPALSIRRENPISWSNCMAVPHSAWERVNGFDERFQGWGGEDTAFAAAVQGLVGWDRMPGFSTNLWHDPSVRQPRTREYVHNERLRDRYAMALRRDHSLHDRPSPGDEPERQRDMETIRRYTSHNPKRKVCYCESCAATWGLSDWSQWWPTLDELVARTPPPISVALIVHTGGAPETWPERSAYLRASLASLKERVHLPRWERQVIWSDWGEERRLELEAIAEEYGLYLPPTQTPEKRRGYTGSMQLMWAYIKNYVRAEYVFQAEDDFRYERDVEVAEMVEALASRPHLVQMALLRAPISEREHAPDTVLGHPCDGFERRGTHLEHRRFFTVNPMLMRASLATNAPWPSGPHSEAVYGRTLFRDPKARAGLWGDGSTWITHIGETRAGGPY